MASKNKNDEDLNKMNQETNVSEELEKEEILEKQEENTPNEENEEKSDGQEMKSAEEEALQNKLVRLQADFLNYKARTEKEKLSTYSNAVSDIVKELLTVVDNFERALDVEKSENNAFREGVQMVYTQFIGILNNVGLKEIEALNKPFDPNYHFGVAVESDCDAEDNTVIEVFQKGYTVKDKVIRPAMVKICKK